MITVNVTVDSEEVLQRLNRMKENSHQSLEPIVTQMARDTREVARNSIPPKVNRGDLLTSLKILTLNNSQNNFKNVLYTDSPYAKYVHDGTSGVWYTHYTDSRLDVSKLDKYGMQPVYGEFYEFHGQEANPFMRTAYTATLLSNKSLAQSMYYQYILK